jgi:dihydropteroate synthase
MGQTSWTWGGSPPVPGAPTLTVEAEWARLDGVIRGALSLGVPLSIDTCKAEVMRRALDLGADIINDIRGLEDEGAVDVVARHGACGVCLMHMQGDPATMQLRPSYPDVVDEVKGYLSQRAEVVRAAGVAQARITLDPGIGFGKTPEHNFRLLREQASLLEMDYPLLIGWSRKSSLGALTGRPVVERLAASLSAALAGVQRGAHIVRVHDVAETVDALKVWAAAGLPDPLA